ncbi:carbohydrate ABC transporter permease [uncultured Phycicoccus sp.]|uniref:carbohydrate ABC transporter permease n=1 Tax=uncultured Phycicoccus sp. TaxID=661422 RepID=UPI00260E223C|nr:sugar ABC transporter permease [uncultured Phycicoccus sp.]
MTSDGRAAGRPPGGAAVLAARGADVHQERESVSRAGRGRWSLLRPGAPGRQTRRRTGPWGRRRAGATPYLFIAPACLLLALFGILPILVAAVVSTTDLDIGGLGDPSTIRFLGLDNYERLFSDPKFWQALRTTTLFVVLGVPVIIALSLTIAVGLNVSTSRLFTVLRAFYFLPAITAIVAVALVWGYLYNSQFGLLNQGLALVGLGPVGWLSDPNTARVSVAVVAIWRATGLNVIIFLAALQAIPQDYHDAAALDGAGRWATFRFVTFPLLRFALFFVTVTTLIGWLQFFDEPYVLTKGGPVGATTSVSLFIFQNGFSFNQFGYASAGSIILFILIAAVTAVQLRLRGSDD